MITLTSRQISLLHVLNSENDFKTIAFLGEKMGVSGRTIHNDLKTIDQYLSRQKRFTNISIEKKRGIGIRLKGDHITRQELINAISFEPHMQIGSTKERREKIAYLLLNNVSAINYRNLAERYFCSISSITNDIQEIEVWLDKFHIKLSKTVHGTRALGQETDIRKAMIALIHEKMIRATNAPDLSINKEENEKIIALILPFISLPVINKSIDMFAYIEDQLNCRFNTNYYVNMIISIAVMLERQAAKHFIKESKNSSQQLNNLHLLKTYIIAKEALDKFCQPKTTTLEEANYLSQCIMGAGIEEAIGSHHLRKYNEDTQKIAKKLCKLASKAFNVHFDQHSVLYKGLLVHLGPMLNRLKFGIVIKNPLIQQIKEQYPAMYGFTSFLASVIEETTRLKMNEDEIGFLLVHFQAALEKNKNSMNITVVCPGGIGTSELVANRIKRLVPNINISHICSVRALNNAENVSDIDFIVSTVPLNHVNKPTILVSPMMNVTDAKSLYNFVLDYSHKKEARHLHFPHLSAVLNEKAIFLNLNINNKLAAIKFLSEQLLDQNLITSAFIDSLIEREKIATTDLGNYVAIPHGNGRYVNTSVISIASLNCPIEWGKSKVSLIILIALSSNEKESRNIMGDLYNLFDSESLLKELKNATSAKQVMALLS